LGFVPNGWEDNVRCDTTELGGGAAGAVELLNRELQGTQVVCGRNVHDLRQIMDALNRAFAMRRGVAHDQGAAIILKGAGDNFGSGGAEAAGQDDQWSVISDG